MLGSLLLMVVLVAGAATGVITTVLGSSSDTSPGTSVAPAGQAAGQQALRTDRVPAALAPLFVQAAEESGCGLPPALLAAQAQVESGYRQDAVSTAGAVGIMQFLPSTWTRSGVDGNGDGVASITDPADAIPSAARLNCTHLAQIRAAGISGDLTGLMLAAYNAGPGTVLSCRCIPANGETPAYVAAIERLAPTLAAATTPEPNGANAPGDGVQLPPGAMTAAGCGYPLAVRAPVTQTFGAHADGTYHPGMDLAAPYGTPVLASTAGTVVTVQTPDQSGGYGNYVCIQVTVQLSSCYAHLAVITVTAGQPVSRGTQIGLEGSTGNSTGPHLHYEIRINGQVTDPAPYVPAP